VKHHTHLPNHDDDDYKLDGNLNVKVLGEEGYSPKEREKLRGREASIDREGS